MMMAIDGSNNDQDIYHTDNMNNEDEQNDSMLDQEQEQEEHELSEATNNFTPIQLNKRFPQSLCSFSLCHSMDLVALGLGTSMSTPNGTTGSNISSIEDLIQIDVCNTIVVHRTISWQKMLSVGTSDLVTACAEDANNNYHSIETKHDGDDNNNKNDDEINLENGNEDTFDNNAEEQQLNENKDEKATMGGTFLTWAPDGRAIAIGLVNGGVLLYDIEASASPGVPPTAAYHIIPPQPSSLPTTGTEEELATTEQECSKSPKRKTNCTRRSISPVVTRSMTAARRKRLLRMMGQTPNNNLDDDDLFTEEKSMSDENLAGFPPRPSKTSSNKTETTQPKHSVENHIRHLRKTLGWKASSVTALTWQRVGPKHKDWILTEDELEEEATWNFQRKYFDQSLHFLPPCEYSIQQSKRLVANGSASSTSGVGSGSSSHFGGGNGGTATNSGISILQSRRELDQESRDGNDCTVDRYQPQCQTPLSVLCMATVANGMHLYLHGRYRILSLASPVCTSNANTSIVCSADLTSILLCTVSPTIFTAVDGEGIKGGSTNDATNQEYTFEPSIQMRLYTIPSMKLNRYPLQIISSSYCSIMTHLSSLERGMKEAAAAWSGSLRQLDTKFEQLANLLTKYGLVPSGNSTSNNNDEVGLAKATSVRMELLNYILGGHSKRSTDTSNAMDQFFTHPLMNDKLLQRLERQLESNLAGVEAVIRKKMLGPVRALVYDVSELHGLVKKMNSERGGVLNSFDDDDDIDDPLVDLETSTKLCETSELFYIIVEQCVAHVVEIRLRLQSIVKWIRGTASQVKARGTAMDSVQRDNARKRRVSEGTLQKVADFLSAPLKSESVDVASGGGGTTTIPTRGITESVLGIFLSDYFSKAKVFDARHVPTGIHQHNQGALGDKNEAFWHHVEIPSVKAALEMASKFANSLFDQPRSVMEKSLHYIDLSVEECMTKTNNITAVHKRLGGVRSNVDEDPSCFSPTIIAEDKQEDILLSTRHWTILATLSSTTIENRQLIQIVAFPVGEAVENVGNLHNDGYDEDSTQSFYLTSFAMVPKNYNVKKITFYGDDGNSTLTSGSSDSTKEGIQALGILLERSDPSNSEISEDFLCIFPYDRMQYNVSSNEDEKTGKFSIRGFDDSVDNYAHLYFTDDLDEEDDVYGRIPCRRRLLRSRQSASDRQVCVEMMLSGSRGIGGIVYGDINTVDMFDLEEDEEGNEDSDEET